MLIKRRLERQEQQLLPVSIPQSPSSRASLWKPTAPHPGLISARHRQPGPPQHHINFWFCLPRVPGYRVPDLPVSAPAPRAGSKRLGSPRLAQNGNNCKTYPIPFQPDKQQIVRKYPIPCHVPLVTKMQKFFFVILNFICIKFLFLQKRQKNVLKIFSSFHFKMRKRETGGKNMVGDQRRETRW